MLEIQIRLARFPKKGGRSVLTSLLSNNPDNLNHKRKMIRIL